MAITPQITKTYASGQLEETHQLVYRGSRLTFCLMLIMCLPIIVETPSILSIWLKEVPNGAVLFLRLLLIIVIIQKYTSPLATAVSSTGRIKKYETLVNGLMLTILPIAYLVLYFGGAPWSVFVIYLIIVIIAFVLILYIFLCSSFILFHVSCFCNETIIKFKLSSLSSNYCSYIHQHNHNMFHLWP